MENLKKILITGATGAVGPLIVNTFLEAGYGVRTFSLDAAEKGLFHSNVDERVGNINDLASVRSAMKDIHGVIHLAALLHVLNPGPEDFEQYQKINVRGTETVVRAALDNNVPRIIYFSTISVYGPGNFEILTEQSPVNPESFYAKTKLDAEKVVLQAKDEKGLPIGTVLRLAAVYGSTIKGNYYRLARALAGRRFIPIGPGKNRRTLIYDKDLARATLAVLETKTAAGKIYNVTDGEIYSVKEIVSAITDALGHAAPKIFVPVPVARMGAGMMEFIGNMCGKRSLNFKSMIEKYTEDVAVSGKRFETEVGFEPEYYLSAGWCDAIKEMRMKGDI